MLSKSNVQTLQRKFDNERRMARRQEREHKAAFAKRLGKAITIGLFAYITMITGQVADWIGIPLIMWNLCSATNAVDRYLDWRWAPWQR